MAKTKRPVTLYEKYWLSKNSDQLNDFGYKWPVISHLLPRGKKITILDYGCGTGKIYKELRKMNPKSTIFGVDISKTAIGEISKAFPNNKFATVRDGQRLPFRSFTIDYIVALDVIEHVVNTDILLNEFNRILTPKGKLFVSTPYHGVFKNIIISMAAFEVVFNPFGPHLRFFTDKSLSRGLISHRFRVLKHGFYGRYFPLWRGMYYLSEKGAKS